MLQLIGVLRIRCLARSVRRAVSLHRTLTTTAAGFTLLLTISSVAHAQTAAAPRSYENRLTPITDPQPLLADHPRFVEPVRETRRFEAPALVQDDDADLSVRAWRFSYNARGIIELPNHLRGRDTAIIVVHPWGIDDGQGWCTPQPAGAAFQCTPEKNLILNQHITEVVNPFLTALRPRVGLVLYSLPGTEDPIRKKLYRSFRGEPTEAERKRGPRSWRRSWPTSIIGAAICRPPCNCRRICRWSITFASFADSTRRPPSTTKAFGNCRFPCRSISRSRCATS